MAQFDDTKEEEKVAQLRAQEEEALAQILSTKYGVEYTDLSMFSIDTDALRLVPEAKARAAKLAVFSKHDKQISVAVLSPANDKTKQAVQELKDNGYDPVLFMVSTNSLEHAWSKYQDVTFASASKHGSLEISDEDITKTMQSVKSIQDAAATIKDMLNMDKAFRTSRIVEVFLASAIALSASDLHVEPMEKATRLRFRIDGILTDITNFDLATYQLLLSRIKLLSGLKLNIKDAAQDGRFSIHLNGNEVEVRTSVLPSEYGESIVLRILNPETILIPMEKLGMNDELLKIIEHEIKQPNGLMVTTGPTGSGKTTMLYAFLRKIYTPGIKVITLEDPIEYHLSGIVQTQIDEKKGYSFASGLGSVLRQDPDVIMVGEIRDKATAKTAINAALTGHMVFSTLHTNDAAGAIPRLLELGVDQKIIPSALRAAMAQRLVRKLCEKCKKRVPLEGAARATVEGILKTIQGDAYVKETTERSYVWEPGSCDECNQTGYKGRIGVFEAILMDDEVEKVVRTNPTERSIAASAKQQEILSMAQDGILKVLRGITSLEELTRVVELEE